MKVVYISGCYRAKKWNKNLITFLYPAWKIYEFIIISINIYKARKVANKYWRKSFVVICPHSNTAYFTLSNDIFIEGYLELVRRSDIIVMLPGWKESEGAIREYQEAIQYGLEIIEVENETL